MGLTKPLFSPFGNDISGRDLILLIGGLFLIGKAVFELHHKLEGHEGSTGPSARSRRWVRARAVLLIDSFLAVR